MDGQVKGRVDERWMGCWKDNGWVVVDGWVGCRNVPCDLPECSSHEPNSDMRLALRAELSALWSTCRRKI